MMSDMAIAGTRAVGIAELRTNTSERGVAFAVTSISFAPRADSSRWVGTPSDTWPSMPSCFHSLWSRPLEPTLRRQFEMFPENDFVKNRLIPQHSRAACEG